MSQKVSRKILVCEGACNPEIASLDAQVNDARRRVHGAIPSLPSSLLASLRRLRHTLHESLEDNRDRYRCSVCGAERSF